MTTTTTHTIDAKGKRLGRVASAAASVLMGKNRADFARNKIPDVTVRIENASKLTLSEYTKANKTYRRYSGYMGGLKEESFNQLVARKGYKAALEHAVYGMLPGNRLRPRMMKNLVITE